MARRAGHTLREVAELAGVSIGTASRVLANNPSVSVSMREAVRKAAHDLAYEPPRRALRGGGGTAVGVLTREGLGIGTSNPFYSYVLEGIQRAASDRGLSLMYEAVPEHGDDAWRLPWLLRPANVKAVIMMGYVSDEFARHVCSCGVPAVVVDHRLDSLPIDTVCNDDFGGARHAVRRLLDWGHRDPVPAVITGPLHHGSLSARFEGYRAALREAGLRAVPAYVRPGNLDAASGYAETMALLDLPTPPTAVFCFNDLMAIGALNALHERGVQVPRDCTVVGYDDTDLAVHTNPPLTSVAIDKTLLGMQAVWHLSERWSHPEISARRTLVPAGFTERRSAGVRPTSVATGPRTLNR